MVELTSYLAVVVVMGTQPYVVEEGNYRQFKPVYAADVQIQDTFWAPRMRTNHDVTVDHCLDWCDSTGRISNFAKAGGLMEGEFEGIYFNDSDVYKVLQGAAHSLALFPNAELEKRVDDVIAKIAAAQHDNGYLNTYYTIAEPGERWADLRVRHELYCAGHLFEAAVAHYQATGKRTLLDVACRFADLIDTIFGPEKRHDVPGHEEIELALVKLYRITGEERYFKLAEFFVDERGRDTDRKLYGKQLQDHTPVREQDEVFGHAVRAMYLFSGVADIAAYTGDQGYIMAMEKIWTDLTQHKMYITGGIGVSGHGEGFSAGYDLPNEHAYCETCASIALAFWSHRLTLHHGDARYADVLERVLYNGLLSGVSMDGDKFFYVNPLLSRGVASFRTSGGKEGESKQHRQHWFGCACCPSNIVRFMPTIGEYVYAATYNSVYVNLYVSSQARIIMHDNVVALTQETNYPWDGDVKLTVEPERHGHFLVALRIPEWCDGASVRVNGRRLRTLDMHKGYARISREWESGDEITLRLPMAIRRIESNPLVYGNSGRVALQRGPLVYCLEGIDNGGRVLNLALPDDVRLKARHRPDLLGGVTVIEGKALVRTDEAKWETALYRPANVETESTRFTAIPYYAWDNREPGEMIVWLPQDPLMAESGAAAE